MSSQADFSHIIDELDDTYLTIKIQKSKQLKSKIMKKWWMRK